jgi:hypothetical protein
MHMRVHCMTPVLSLRVLANHSRRSRHPASIPPLIPSAPRPRSQACARGLPASHAVRAAPDARDLGPRRRRGLAARLRRRRRRGAAALPRLSSRRRHRGRAGRQRRRARADAARGRRRRRQRRRRRSSSRRGVPRVCREAGRGGVLVCGPRAPLPGPHLPPAGSWRGGRGGAHVAEAAGARGAAGGDHVGGGRWGQNQGPRRLSVAAHRRYFLVNAGVSICRLLGSFVAVSHPCRPAPPHKP